MSFHSLRLINPIPGALLADHYATKGKTTLALSPLSAVRFLIGPIWKTAVHPRQPPGVVGGPAPIFLALLTAPCVLEFAIGVGLRLLQCVLGIANLVLQLADSQAERRSSSATPASLSTLSVSRTALRSPRRHSSIILTATTSLSRAAPI